MEGARARTARGRSRADALSCFRRRAAREDPRSPCPTFTWAKCSGSWDLRTTLRTHGERASACPTSRPAATCPGRGRDCAGERLRGRPRDGATGGRAGADRTRGRMPRCAAAAANGDRRLAASPRPGAGARGRQPHRARMLALALGPRHRRSRRAELAARCACPRLQRCRVRCSRSWWTAASRFPTRSLRGADDGGHRMRPQIGGRGATAKRERGPRACRRLLRAGRGASPTASAFDVAAAHRGACIARWSYSNPGSAGWAPAQAAVADAVAGLPGDALTLTVLCTGDVESTRTAWSAPVPSGTVFVALPAPAEGAMARVLAARDCDVLVDAAGLTAPTGLMLAARPARGLGLAAGRPAHERHWRAHAGRRTVARRAALTALHDRGHDRCRLPASAEELGGTVGRRGARPPAGRPPRQPKPDTGRACGRAGVRPGVTLAGETALARDDSVHAGARRWRSRRRRRVREARLSRRCWRSAHSAECGAALPPPPLHWIRRAGGAVADAGPCRARRSVMARRR